MKQNEIVRGETYLFKSTEVENRKHLIGKPFTVRSIKKGKKKVPPFWSNQEVAYGPMHFINEKGEKATANELQPLK